MADILAESRLYQSFLLRMVDVSLGSETLTASSQLDCLTEVSREGSTLLVSESSLVCELTTNIIIARAELKSESTLVCNLPTYIRIDIDKLEFPEGVDIMMNITQGFMVDPETYLPNDAAMNFLIFRAPLRIRGEVLAASSSISATAD